MVLRLFHHHFRSDDRTSSFNDKKAVLISFEFRRCAEGRFWSLFGATDEFTDRSAQG